MTLTDARRTRATAAPARRGRSVAGRVLVVVVLAVVLVAAWLGSVAGRVWWTARQDSHATVDAIVVLGASQWNGTPTEVFAARLDHAAALYGDGVAPVVVTVGGKLRGDAYTEADSGKSYLAGHGVAGRDVVALPVGHDTWHSLRAVDRLAEERGWTSVMLVSDPWHEFRSREMAERLGLHAETSPTRSGPAVWTRKAEAESIVRETLAYAWWRLAGGAPWRGPDIA